MKIVILGGGLSGIANAHFLQDKFDDITILEKETSIGGLCRSFESPQGIQYDIGPHIIFSKNKRILDFMVGLLDNSKVIRRSNRILHKDIHASENSRAPYRLLQYPFENDLSKLAAEERKFVEESFVNNPYRNYVPTNMQQFFLKQFGQGISDLYLLPYNKKIWKWDPSYLDMQMVERIPAPTNEEIFRSLNGETVDGYVHQLYFYYPHEGGIFTLVKNLAERTKAKVMLNEQIVSIVKQNNQYLIRTQNGHKYYADKIISTIPLNDFVDRYEVPTGNKPKFELLHNDIYECLFTVEGDIAGENFAFMISDSNIVFHRVSKVDYLGKNYHKDNTTSLLVEVTVRKGQELDRKQLHQDIIYGLNKCFKVKVIDWSITKFDNAYVVYDLNHRRNVDNILAYFRDSNIYFSGRQGLHEYMNMDTVIENAEKTAEIIKVGK